MTDAPRWPDAVIVLGIDGDPIYPSEHYSRVLKSDGDLQNDVSIFGPDHAALAEQIRACVRGEHAGEVARLTTERDKARDEVGERWEFLSDQAGQLRGELAAVRADLDRAQGAAAMWERKWADAYRERDEARERLARTGGVLSEIAAERARQTEKHGDQSHLPLGFGADVWWRGSGSIPRLQRHGMRLGDLAEWAKARTKAASQNEGGDGSITFEHILTEEVFEAFAEDDPAKARVELIQVAAVAVQIVEAIDSVREVIDWLDPAREAGQ